MLYHPFIQSLFPRISSSSLKNLFIRYILGIVSLSQSIAPEWLIKPGTSRVFYRVSQNSLSLYQYSFGLISDPDPRTSLFFIHPFEAIWGVYCPEPWSDLYIWHPNPLLLSQPPSPCPLHWLSFPQETGALDSKASVQCQARRGGVQQDISQ